MSFDGCILEFVTEVRWSLYEGAKYAFAAWRHAGLLTNLACRIVAVPRLLDEETHWRARVEAGELIN